MEGFTGVISDLGGPTANMYRMACKSETIEASCRKLSCVYPGICENLNTDHTALIQLYRKARNTKGIKKVLIGSGLRYDLAVTSPEYVKELVQHHVGGYLKIAPEHSEENVLSKMMKPGMGSYNKFKEMFDRFSKEVGKEQYLIPYFIAAHPGTTDEDMLNVAAYLEKQAPGNGTAKNKASIELGQKIYRGGIPGKNVAACAGCHAPNGAGIPAQYPRLAGQWAEYTEAQLVAYRSGERKNSVQMTGVASRMSDAEIKAVSDYIAGLR